MLSLRYLSDPKSRCKFSPYLSSSPRLLLDQFTPEQLERYEVYRRSGFQKGSIRKVGHADTSADGMASIIHQLM